MPDRICQVTVTDSTGTRHTLQISAPSVSRAACYFWAKVRSTPSLPQIKFEDETVYEVQAEGSEVVHRITHRKMLTWANAEAERQNR